MRALPCTPWGLKKIGVLTPEGQFSASDLPGIDADINITALDDHTASDHDTALDDYTASDYRAASDDINDPYDSELAISETKFDEKKMKRSQMSRSER